MNVIGIIGCGHMGSAIAEALVFKKIRVIASKRSRPVLKFSHSTKKLFTWTVNNREVVRKADIVIIAVKPFDVAHVLAEIAPVLEKRHVLVSVAAGVSLAQLKKFSGNHPKIVRVLPNLPAKILHGVSVWKSSLALSKKEKMTIDILLNSFGYSLRVHNETLIDKAIVSGCGPAYTAAFLETLSHVSERFGYNSQQSRLIALETVIGAALYIKKTGMDFTALKNAVQTKGGVTEASFKVLNEKKWQKILEEACEAAFHRVKTLIKPKAQD